MTTPDTQFPTRTSHGIDLPMDSERWERIQSLFHEAVDRPPTEQRAFLESACPDDPALFADVLAMLNEDARASSLLDRDLDSIAEELGAKAGRPSFDSAQFHPYSLKSLLGEGGMGVVYLAERVDLGNHVAIKILRDTWLSDASRRRFAEEQRTLARLNHPGIARLYDAQTLPNGTPWFVMEYVDGVPLNEYCTQNQASIEDRLALFRAACEAVQYAHDRGVIHRDLKPSNILVKADGSVRLLDFGIAKRLDLIDAGVEHTRTGTRLMTPAYAAPEQMRGEPAGIRTDIYSLGVMLYQLLAGRLPFDVSHMSVFDAPHTSSREPTKPSVAAKQAVGKTGARVAGMSTAAWADLDILCLTCMHQDPKRRYPSVEALIRDLDHFRRDEPLEARPDNLGYTLGKFVRRRWRALSAAGSALMLVGLAVVLGLTLKARSTGADSYLSMGGRTVAVLPFRNANPDSSQNFLRLALADEVANTLSYTRFLLVRAFATTSKYMQADLDPQKIGQEIGVARIVSGRFLSGQNQVWIELEALDVDSNLVLWRDTIRAPAGNMIAIRERVAARAQGPLAVALGATASTPQTATAPTNEEAYTLYLRTAGVPYEPGPNKEAIRMLERAVSLDSTYVSALLALARRYYVDSRYESGDRSTFARSLALTERAVALDPNFSTARARLTGFRVEAGELAAAYRESKELVRQRPESSDAHFLLSYVLRYAGLLNEAARECQTALSLDPNNFGWRSCAVVSLGLGDYASAMSYIHLDPNGEFAKALTIHTLVRQGREREALQVARPNMPNWKSYAVLLACVERRSAAEVAALAKAVEPDGDPESNYFAAAHLAYCGQSSAAVQLLKAAIQGNYCSYPAIDSDPYFTRVRATREFQAIRSTAIACQKRFLAERTP